LLISIGVGELGVKVFRVFCASCARIIVVILASIFTNFEVLAQPGPDFPRHNTPAIVVMPPVTPEQANGFFARRIVPESNVPAPPRSSSSGAPEEIPVIAPILGHEFSTVDPPFGFGRADFAIPKSKDNKDRMDTNAHAVVGKAPPGTAVREEPPQVSKP
jgi:hypothetical protein